MEAINVISIMDKGVIICGISLMVGDGEKERVNGKLTIIWNFIKL